MAVIVPYILFTNESVAAEKAFAALMIFSSYRLFGSYLFGQGL